MTIRKRLTLWYTVLLAASLCIAFALMYYNVRDNLMERSRADIIRDATIIADEVEEDDGYVLFDLDDDELETITGGTIFALYSFDNQWLDGRRLEWMDSFGRSYNELRIVSYNSEPWFLYDKIAYDDGIALGWARVLMPLSPVYDTLSTIFFASLVIFLPFMLFAIAGGLFIAGIALKPIKQITKTAVKIGSGDFHTRIEHVKGKDEVGQLAASFNEMAENVEAAFNREKQFSSDASHEIRTPIAVIVAQAEDALNRHDIDEYKNSMAVILEKSSHIQDMLSKLLTLARGYEQADSMSIENIDISCVIADIAEEMQPIAADAGIEIRTELEKNITINADLLMITAMLLNLIDNSIKYGNTGGYVKVTLAKTGGEIVITVEDNGKGISEEDLPHIFKRLYRADKSRNSKGTGLGLLFVYNTVKLHKGSISVDSTLGEGSTFTITLLYGEKTE